SAARHPIVAVAADHVVVLAFAKQRIATLHPIDEVVAALTMDFIGGTDIQPRGRRVIRATRRVVELLDRPHNDVVVGGGRDTGGSGVGADLVVVVVVSQQAIDAGDAVGARGVPRQRG